MLRAMLDITRDGVRIAYEERGSGDRSFIFVHGWTCNRSYFAPQVEYFASAGYRTLSVDLRGHGESDKPEGPYSIRTFADDVAHVIRELGVRRPIAVGHSMGGTTVLQLGASHPETVDGVVMVDPAPLVFPEERKTALGGMLAALEAGDRGSQREFIEQSLFLPTDDAATRDRVVAEMCAAPAHVAIACMRAILDFDGPSAAAACSVPALHVAAEPPLNPQALMAEHLKGVVNAQTVGAGHFNQLLVPVQVNDMIDRFAETYVFQAA